MSSSSNYSNNYQTNGNSKETLPKNLALRILGIFYVKFKNTTHHEKRIVQFKNVLLTLRFKELINVSTLQWQ